VFLSSVDLRELTGYVRPSAQARWLTDNGLPFYLDAQGRPKVMREMLLAPAHRPKRPDLSRLT
jgi:hypothetical protein